jgi:hypothetical protein
MHAHTRQHTCDCRSLGENGNMSCVENPERRAEPDGRDSEDTEAAALPVALV